MLSLKECEDELEEQRRTCAEFRESLSKANEKASKDSTQSKEELRELKEINEQLLRKLSDAQSRIEELEALMQTTPGKSFDPVAAAGSYTSESSASCASQDLYDDPDCMLSPKTDSSSAEDSKNKRNKRSLKEELANAGIDWDSLQKGDSKEAKDIPGTDVHPVVLGHPVCWDRPQTSTQNLQVEWPVPECGVSRHAGTDVPSQIALPSFEDKKFRKRQNADESENPEDPTDNKSGQSRLLDPKRDPRKKQRIDDQTTQKQINTNEECGSPKGHNSAYQGYKFMFTMPLQKSMAPPDSKGSQC